MAVGEATGATTAPAEAPTGPKRLVTAGGGRRKDDMPEPGKPDIASEVEAEVVVPAATGDSLDEQFNAEEDIERRTTSEHHEAPHFKKEVD